MRGEVSAHDLARRYTLAIRMLDGEWVTTCAQFPSLSWIASDPRASVLGFLGLLEGCIEDMRRSGEPVPEP